MEIAIIASEIAGFSKVGGMGDVVGTLPPFFIKKGIKVNIFSPAYKQVFDNIKVEKTDIKFLVELGNDIFKCSVYKFAYDHDSSIYFIDNKEFFRYRNVYVDDDDILYEDNTERFTLFQKAVLELIVILGKKPDVIHCHDNQAALIPLFLKTKYSNVENFKYSKSILTIHNIGYHGTFDMVHKHLLNLDEKLFYPMEKLEWYGEVNPLKSGIIYADKITTVSKTHAKEITEDEILSAGMKNVFHSRSDKVIGIVNGLNFDEWNPAIDKDIRKQYSIDTIQDKQINRQALLKECGINKQFHQKPVFGMVTRLVEQKGIVLILNIFEKLMEEGISFILLGNGNPNYKDEFVKLQKKYKGQFHFDYSFNKVLGHKIFGGCDVFLMPSRYEPCGIAQMQSMKYGTLPLVNKTGGLVDTIEHNKTGFIFDEYHAKSFYNMVLYAKKSFENKEKWNQMVKNAMLEDFSWDKSVEKYIKLYEELIKSVD